MGIEQINIEDIIFNNETLLSKKQFKLVLENLVSLHAADCSPNEYQRISKMRDDAYYAIIPDLVIAVKNAYEKQNLAKLKTALMDVNRYVALADKDLPNGYLKYEKPSYLLLIINETDKLREHVTLNEYGKADCSVDCIESYLRISKLNAPEDFLTEKKLFYQIMLDKVYDHSLSLVEQVKNRAMALTNEEYNFVSTNIIKLKKYSSAIENLPIIYKEMIAELESLKLS